MCTHLSLLEKSRERDDVADLILIGRVMLQWVLEEQTARCCTHDTHTHTQRLAFESKWLIHRVLQRQLP